MFLLTDLGGSQRGCGEITRDAQGPIFKTHTKKSSRYGKHCRKLIDSWYYPTLQSQAQFALKNGLLWLQFNKQQSTMEEAWLHWHCCAGLW